MKKRIDDGFTLVELLAVVVIVGVVALIAVPTVIGNIEESRKRLYDTQVQNIELAAKKWAIEYRKELDSEYLNATYVSVQMLRDLGFVAAEDLKNPVNGETMAGCVTVAYDSTTKSYTYVYDDANTACTDTTAKGYYYSKTGGSWVKDETRQRESIYSYLVGDNAVNIVASGPGGLFDMGDRYVFRGHATNNYVKLDGVYYRIISLDKNTKTLKLIELNNNGRTSAWKNTTNISFNTTTLYESLLSTSPYSSIANKNVKWNIGKITNTEGLNLNSVKAYESTAQIESEIGLISMSEYMEASLDEACSSGNLASCSNLNYLNIPDSWTMTTTETSVVYVTKNAEGASNGLTYETNLTDNYHFIHRVVNISATERSANADGTIDNPFIITTES